MRPTGREAESDTGVVWRACRARGRSGRAAEKSWSPTILRDVTYDIGGGWPSKNGEELPPSWPLAAAADAQRMPGRKTANNAEEGQTKAAQADAATAARMLAQSIAAHPRWPAAKHGTVVQNCSSETPPKRGVAGTRALPRNGAERPRHGSETSIRRLDKERTLLAVWRNGGSGATRFHV